MRQFEHLLVFCPDTQAESILIVPALRALREAYRSSRITLMALPATYPAACSLPFVDTVHTRREEKEADYIRTISELGCDGAVIFTSPGQSPYPDAYRCYFAGIPFRLGMSSEFDGGVLSHWAKPLPSIRPVDRYLSLVTSVGLPGAGRRLL